MIVRLSGGDEPLYPHLFHQMYRQRHDIYVKRRKWSGLTPIDDLERDRYDTARATYLLAVDEGENVLAGLRLLPTCGPHLFADAFPHLAQGRSVPRGGDILELTRFYVAVSPRAARARRRTIGVLAAGLFEHCLECGVRQLTSVVDTFLVPRMVDLGWQVRRLGEPCRYGEGIAVAVAIDVTGAILDTIRQRRGIHRRVLRGRAMPTPNALADQSAIDVPDGLARATGSETVMV